MEICPCCGDPARFEIAEVCLEARELVLDACCEANLEGWLDEIRAAPRKARAEWMLREAAVAVHDILVGEDTVCWTLDYGLRLEKISLDAAKEFIARHHRHCAPPVGWKYGAAVWNGHDLVGVMTAGRPVSAALAKQGCVEVNRVCVEDTRPHALVRNACSMLYGYACREAFQRGCDRVITYTLASERGTSLRAAGFRPVARTPGGTWDRPGRPRPNATPTEPKIRWERWSDGKSVAIQLPLALVA